MPSREFSAVLPLSEPGSTRQWFAWQSLLLMLAALLLLGVFEVSDLDRQLVRLFFDAQQHVFPLRRAWLLDVIFHHGAKQITYLLVAASLYLCWQGWRGWLVWLPPRNALLAALGMITIPLATSVIKMLTARYCPWDLVEFGGYAPYLSLFGVTPPGLKPGQCFPAGHASTGFLWIVWAVALRPAGKRVARYALLAALSAGIILGTARMLQGAHFLSHTLWTLWLAWALSVLLAFALRAEIRLAR